MQKKTKAFNPTAPAKYKCDGGYSSGTIHPSKIATELFKGEIPGAMLCCYMLRRFGWPNEGSDSYKSLMSWSLTTPIKGLFLSVTPYLGARGGPPEKHCSNLHFGIRFTEEIGRKIDLDRGREQFFKRYRSAIMGWWRKKGIKLYAWCVGHEVEDKSNLVHEWGECTKKKGYIYGLYRRTEEIKWKGDLPKQLMMVEWWLEKLIKEKHPEVRIPKMSKRERSLIGNPFRRECEQAIRRTMLDLLRPTNVRDISFTPFGDIEREPEAIQRYNKQGHVDYFIGAGNTPEYWFKHATMKERQRED